MMLTLHLLLIKTLYTMNRIVIGSGAIAAGVVGAVLALTIVAATNVTQEFQKLFYNEADVLLTDTATATVETGEIQDFYHQSWHINVVNSTAADTDTVIGTASVQYSNDGVNWEDAFSIAIADSSFAALDTILVDTTQALNYRVRFAQTTGDSTTFKARAVFWKL